MPRAKQWAVKMRRREYGATVTQLTPITEDPRQLAYYLVAVFTSIEDYLTEDGTEVRWAGKGAEASGLGGPVNVDALEQVLRGVDPEAVAADSPVGEVVASPQRTVMGWEMSVAPPKSSSVLWAVAGEAGTGGDRSVEAGRYRRAGRRAGTGGRLVTAAGGRPDTVGPDRGADRRPGAADHEQGPGPTAA